MIGASGGIGSAIVETLSHDDGCVEILELSRSRHGMDIRDEASIALCASRLAGMELDLIVCATGALSIDGAGPDKSLHQIDAHAMAQQFAVNAVGPALVLKHFSAFLPRDRRSIFALLSARVGSIGDNRLGGWMAYRASKAALNQIVRTAAIEVARRHPDAVLVAVHPGTVATKLSLPYNAKREMLQPAESALRILGTLDQLSPAQSGRFFAYDGQPIEW